MLRTKAIGYRPKQMIPETEKTAEWVMDNADYHISQFGTMRAPEDDLAYDLYSGKRDEAQFNVLTKTYGIDFPEKVKHYPLVRPLLEQLVGEEWKRSLNFTVRTEDVDSLQEKDEERKNKILKAIGLEMQREVREGDGKFDKNMAKLEKYYMTEFRSQLEIGSHKVLKSLVTRMNLKDHFNEQFKDQIITGKEFYQVRVLKKGQDPYFKVLDPRNVRVNADDDVVWAKEASSAIIKERMSPIEVMDRYGSELKQNEIDLLESELEQYHSAAKIHDATDLENGLVSNEVLTEASMEVHHVEFKSIRKVNVLKMTEGEKKILRLISDEELVELPKKRRKQVKNRYIQDLWRCTRIGDGIYVDMGKEKYPVRSITHPSKVNLTINGRINRTRTDKPYSLVLACRDLQDLYDILHFHKANLMALSGTKGMVMDMSQLPDLGGKDEAENMKLWLYYKKLGVAWIDSSKEDAGEFNQFGTYDDTFGAGLSAILQMIQHLEEMAGRITGVNRQRLGAMTQTDGKAVSEAALIQSSINTEPIFKEHYLVVGEELKDILNAARISYSEGFTGTYLTGDYGNEVFTMDAGWDLADYGVLLDNIISEERQIEELKALANQLVANQMLDVEDLLSLFRKDSLKEIQIDIRQNTQKKKEEMMDQQGKAAQAEQQAAQAEAQLKAQEVQGKLAEGQEKNRIQETKNQNDFTIDQEKLALERERVALEREQLRDAVLNGNKGKAEVRND